MPFTTIIEHPLKYIFKIQAEMYYNTPGVGIECVHAALATMCHCLLSYFVNTPSVLLLVLAPRAISTGELYCVFLLSTSLLVCCDMCFAAQNVKFDAAKKRASMSTKVL